METEGDIVTSRRRIHDILTATRLMRGRRGRGFTLIELLLALALIILLMAGVFSFYVVALRARDDGGNISREVMKTRWLLQRIGEEVRHAADIVPGDGQGFQGRRDSITIVRTRMPTRIVFERFDSVADELPPAQMDIERINYQLLWDDELVDDEGVPICHGLWRSLQTTFDPNPSLILADEEDLDPDQRDRERRAGPQIHGELIAPEIKFIEFEYFDGAQWRDRWQVAYEGPEVGGEQGDLEEGEVQTLPLSQSGLGGVGYALPQAVRITLGRERESPEETEARLARTAGFGGRVGDEDHYPDRFTIVVPLIQADPSLLSSRKHGVQNQQSLQLGGG